MMAELERSTAANQHLPYLPSCLWEEILHKLRGRDALSVARSSLSFFAAQSSTIASQAVSTRQLRRWVAWAGTPSLARLLSAMKFYRLKRLRIDDGNNYAALTGDVMDIFLSRCALPALQSLEICGIWNVRQEFSVIMQCIEHHLPNLQQLSIPVPPTTSDLAQLLDLPSLTSLTLGNCPPRMTASGAGRIHWSLNHDAPNGRSEGQLSTAEFRVLSQMTNLRSLRISGVNILLSLEASNSLAALTNLQELALGQRCVISHRFPPDFSAWTSLVNLKTCHIDLSRSVDTTMNATLATLVQSLLSGLSSATLTQLTLSVTRRYDHHTDLFPAAAALADPAQDVAAVLGVQAAAVIGMAGVFPAEMQLAEIALESLPVHQLACGATFPALTHLCLPTGLLDWRGVRVLASMCPELRNLTVQSINSLSSSELSEWDHTPALPRLRCLDVIQGCGPEVKWEQLCQLMPDLRMMLMPSLP